MKRIWNFFCLTYLTVILAFLICVVAGWGSIITVYNRPFFEKVDHEIFLPWLFEHGFETPGLTLWIYVLIVLIALFALNTFVCTTDKLYRIVKLGLPKRAFYPQIIHIGFLIALLGHLVGGVGGFRTAENILVMGRKTAVPHTENMMVRLDGLDTEFGSRGPEKVRTTITLFKGNQQLRSADISINSPVIQNGIAFYHKGQGQMTRGLVLAFDDGGESGESGEGGGELSGKLSNDGRANGGRANDGRANGKPANGGRVEVEFGRAFALGNGRFLLGRLYPDYAVDAAGRAYSRSGRYRNPVQVILNAEGEQALLNLSRQGSVVELGGTRIRFVGYATTEYAVVAIHSDPGILFIIVGSLILVVGMLLLLFAGSARGEGRELMKREERSA